MSTLRSLQRIRNQLEHHSVSLDLRQTQSIVGGLCEFVYIFMKEQLSEDLSDHPEPPVWERVQELRGIAKRLEEERELEWRNRAGKYFGLSVADLDMLKASIEPYHPKHNPDPAELYSCPECAAESVVITEDSDIGVCTNSECREVFEVTECTRCYRPVVPDRMFCEECQGYLDSQ